MAKFNLPKSLFKTSSEARQQLVTHLRILHLLHHRSKNQHGRSHWYRHFNKLRRETKALCRDLQLDLGSGFETTSNPAKSKSTKHAKTVATPPSMIDKSAERQAADRLEHWVASGLISKCYVAFTSLAATPSFSPLALTLIAVLARICSLTGVTAHLQSLSTIEADKAAETDQEQLTEALERFAEEDAGELFDRAEDVGTPVPDTGTAVKREMQSAPSEGKPAKRRKRANAIDDLFAGL